MKRAVLLTVMLLGTVMLLLAGCHADFGLRIGLENMPEDAQADLLISGADGEWVSADGVSNAKVEQFAARSDRLPIVMLNCSASKEFYCDFAEQHRVIRLELRDSAGELLLLSDEITLASDEKAGYPRDMTYDCKTGDVKVKNWFSKKVYGKTPTDWLFICIAVSWFMLIPASLTMLLLAVNVKDDRKRKKAEKLTLLIGSIPAVITVAFRTVMYVSPRFNLNEEPLTVNNVIFSLLLVFPWTAALIYLLADTVIEIIKRKRKN